MNVQYLGWHQLYNSRTWDDNDSYQVQRVDCLKYSLVGLQSSLSLGAGVVEVGDGCDPSRTARNEHPNTHSDPTRTSADSVSASICSWQVLPCDLRSSKKESCLACCSHFFESKTLDMYVGDSGRRIRGTRQFWTKRDGRKSYCSTAFNEYFKGNQHCRSGEFLRIHIVSNVIISK